MRASGILLVLLAGLVPAGCGGGGVTSAAEPAPPPPPGISGTVRFVETDLGRITEREPNNQRVQPCLIPIVSARSRLEIAGDIGVTGARSGQADPVDVFRIEVAEATDLAVVLDFPADDPLGGASNDVEIEVFDVATGARLALALDGAPPRETAFHAEASEGYDVVLTCRQGHAPYVLTLDGTSGVAPLEAPKSKATFAVTDAPSDRGTRSHRPDCAGTHVLVRLREGADPVAVAQRHGLARGRDTALGTLRLRVRERVTRDRPACMEALCRQLADDPDVSSAEPDHVVHALMEPDDPGWGRQWNLRAVGAPEAWDITRGSPDVIVGVIDSGIVPHPDLDGRLVSGYDFVSDTRISGDGDARDENPTDEGAEEDPSGLSWWHGTHVAGIIVANADDGYGIAGVAPGCRVMPLRALGRTGGLVSDVTDAILFAAGLHTTEEGHRLAVPLRIVNLSFGVDVDVQELRLACTRAAGAGVLLVGAVGNTGQHVLYPAQYATVLAVGAVDGRLDTTGYSSFGEEVDVSAPGGVMTSDVSAAGWPDAILSCVLDETVHPRSAGHGYLQGTSQAAPHVAGAAALLLSVDPTLERQHVWDLLVGGSLDRGVPGRDVAYGWGVLRIHYSMRLLLAEMGTPWQAPPRLRLAQSALLFEGFTTRHEVVVLNTGAGLLELDDPWAETDDGVDWLVAEGIDANFGSPTTMSDVAVTVDRSAVPSSPGRYTGTVFVPDESGQVLGTIRVVLLVSQRIHAGRVLRSVVHDEDGGITSTHADVSPTTAYRYWFPLLDPGLYKVRGGTDLDGDGFPCEGGDACAWFGGATEAEADVVEVERDETTWDVDVRLPEP